VPMGHRAYARKEGIIHRLLATSCIVLVLTLGVFAASPLLHSWLHHGPDSNSEDSCAVVLFAGGVSTPVGATTVSAPLTDSQAISREVADQIYLASPRYLRQPQCGPPSLS
jgi:hypothetical protein